MPQLARPVLFFHTGNDRCTIKKAWADLYKVQNIAYPIEFYLVEEKGASYSHFLERKATKVDDTKIVLFALRDEELPTIRYHLNNDTLSVRWFSEAAKNYTDAIAVFFVPEGGQLLLNEKWFSQWISFEDTYDFLEDLAKYSYKDYCKLHMDIIDIIYSDNDIKQIVQQIEKVYFKYALLAYYHCPSGAAAIMVHKIIMNKDNLVFST
jgi:hypothetical protein